MVDGDEKTNLVTPDLPRNRLSEQSSSNNGHIGAASTYRSKWTK
jgi:hypothetical protein